MHSNATAAPIVPKTIALDGWWGLDVASSSAALVATARAVSTAVLESRLDKEAVNEVFETTVTLRSVIEIAASLVNCTVGFGMGLASDVNVGIDDAVAGEEGGAIVNARVIDDVENVGTDVVVEVTGKDEGGGVDGDLGAHRVELVQQPGSQSVKQFVSTNPGYDPCASHRPDGTKSRGNGTPRS